MKAKLRRCKEGNQEYDLLWLWCPGCNEYHAAKVNTPNRWTWNGSEEKPTLQPSLLVRSGHYSPGHEGPCWCSYNAEHPGEESKFKCRVCHSFVTDGKIQFLSDSTHELSGQTVDLPDLDKEGL